MFQAINKFRNPKSKVLKNITNVPKSKAQKDLQAKQEKAGKARKVLLSTEELVRNL